VEDVKQGAFFREPDHFELLSERLLPELAREPGRTSVRAWSAGCSSGEEAWSLAMILDEAGLPSTWDVRVIATDSDLQLLAWATNGVYYDGRMFAVSDERRARYFVRGVGPREGLWRVTQPLRDRVELEALELTGPWPERHERGKLDIIVCHRALGELDGQHAARLIYRFADALAPGGVLLLGASKWLPTGIAGFELYGGAAFRKMR